jgi:hypothetical protein
MVVSEVLQASDTEPDWVTGQVVTRRSDGAIVRTNLPAAYSRRGLSAGRYVRLAPSIQQESTWWNRYLHTQVDLRELAAWRLAGDYFLWKTFAEYAAPTVVEAVIGSFRWHGDNMSQDWESYLREVTNMCGPITPRDRMAGIWYRGSWALPNRLKWKLARGRLLRWNWPDGPWI